MNKGLFVLVYRNGPDCTNAGLSSKVDDLVLVTPSPQPLGPFESHDRGVYLCRFVGRLIAVPQVPSGAVVRRMQRCRGGFFDCWELSHLAGWMFGGNFIHTSDSRFPSDAPIHVYDRREF